MRIKRFHGLQLGVSVLCLCCIPAQSQSVYFALHTFQDSPITFINYTPSIFRIEGKRRQFVTVKNVSDKTAAALLFQQTIADGAKPETIALERISIILRPRETKRLSVSVEDVWNRIQNATKSGVMTGKPVLSIVPVEFVESSGWSAPVEK